MSPTLRDIKVLRSTCVAAARGAGATRREARELTEATLRAEQRGHRSVGLEHFLDYLDGFASGTINPRPRATLACRGVWLSADADGGIAQSLVSRALPRMVRVARRQGASLLGVCNAYTAGELGDVTVRLAEAGLLGIAAANSPAAVAWGRKGDTVLGTNPVSLAAPCGDSPPLLIDQGSSSAAFVTIRQAAAEGTPLPAGWALDAQGRETMDAAEALRGALLPFAGHKGANQALVVEVLAGLAGGLWSLDAPPFLGGSTSPSIGLFVLAIDPEFTSPGFAERLRAHLERLERDHGVRIPGWGRSRAGHDGVIEVDDELWKRLNRR